MKLPDFLKYNRTAAIAALIVVILAAVPLGTLRSVGSLQRKVEKIYDTGDNKNGTVRTDLTRLSDYGQNLYAIADSLGCADANFADSVAALRASLDSPLMETDTVTALMSAASLSYNRILNAPDIPESQKNSAISYFYEMDSTRARLQNNKEYESAALRYNDAIETFPASLFCSAKDPAVTFAH